MKIFRSSRAKRTFWTRGVSVRVDRVGREGRVGGEIVARCKGEVLVDMGEEWEEGLKALDIRVVLEVVVEGWRLE